jgi:hypothetical protein
VDNFVRGDGHGLSVKRCTLRSSTLFFHRTIFHRCRYCFASIRPRVPAAWIIGMEVDWRSKHHRSLRSNLHPRTVSRSVSAGESHRGLSNSLQNVFCPFLHPLNLSALRKSIVSGRARTPAFPRHPLASPPKKTRKLRTLATQVRDHCIPEEVRDRSALFSLGAMLKWGLSPNLLVCPRD